MPTHAAPTVDSLLPLDQRSACKVMSLPSRHTHQPSPQRGQSYYNDIQDKQQHILEAMSNKKIQIGRLENLLQRTEEQRATMAKMAIDAKKRRQLQEATRFAKQASQLKTRIENLNSQINLLNEQVFALEEAGTFLATKQELQSGSNVLNQVLVHDHDFEVILAENRRQLDASSAVSEALRVDASLCGPEEDADQLFKDLEDEYGIEYQTEPHTELPDVPGLMPRPPTASSSTATASETERIRTKRAI